MAGNKKALCVGINRFKHFPGAALQGCVADAKDMAAMLQTFCGFGGADITTLYDAKATKANILKNLSAMVNGAKKGKYAYLVFSLSSHGTQVPDINGDESTDHVDEALIFEIITTYNSKKCTKSLPLQIRQAKSE